MAELLRELTRGRVDSGEWRGRGRGATTAGQIWDSHLIQGLARQQQKIGLLSRYRRNEEEIESVKESGLIGVEEC